jgi:hypothetical protein
VYEQNIIKCYLQAKNEHVCILNFLLAGTLYNLTKGVEWQILMDIDQFSYRLRMRVTRLAVSATWQRGGGGGG